MFAPLWLGGGLAHPEAAILVNGWKRVSALVTEGQNRANRSKDTFVKKPSSMFKGVCWHKKADKWKSGISINNENKYLGLFIEEEDAALAYDAAARAVWGEFARTNFPLSGGAS